MDGDAEGELGAFAFCAGCLDTAVHELAEFFADGEAEA